MCGGIFFTFVASKKRIFSVQISFFYACFFVVFCVLSFTHFSSAKFLIFLMNRPPPKQKYFFSPEPNKSMLVFCQYQKTDTGRV